MPVVPAKTQRRPLPRIAPLLACLLVWAPVAGATTAGRDPVASLEELVRRFGSMTGLSARFEEDKEIALLARPLRSRGELFFVPPRLLVRRVEEPAPSLLRLDGDELQYSDAGGSERFDLAANPTARLFARTFTDVLAGDLPRLREAYEIGFRPEQPPREGSDPTQTAWQLELTPRDPALAQVVERVVLRGHGTAPLDLRVEEASGDVTVTRFANVDATRRFEPPEIARLLRPPGS